jgi:hypothetical protein
MSIRTPACNCPWCGTQLTAATDPKDESNAPSPNNAALCLQCGEWCMFTEDLTLRKPTDEEFEMIVANETGRDIRAAWVELRKNRC